MNHLSSFDRASYLEEVCVRVVGGAEQEPHHFQAAVESRPVKQPEPLSVKVIQFSWRGRGRRTTRTTRDNYPIRACHTLAEVVEDTECFVELVFDEIHDGAVVVSLHTDVDDAMLQKEEGRRYKPILVMVVDDAML